MIENPIERLKIYSSPQDNGVRVDVEALASDLICVTKMAGKGLVDVQELLKELWNTVEVEFFPGETKN